MSLTLSSQGEVREFEKNALNQGQVKECDDPTS